MIQIDTEFQALIPALTAEEYAGLEQNIIDNGCRQPLDVWGDILIDGHNRYSICQKHNIPFKTQEIVFDDRDAALVWIIRNQLDRRNLPMYERGRLELLQAATLERRAKENLSRAGKETHSNQYKKEQPFVNSQKVASPINVIKTVSKMSGIGEQTLSRIKRLESKAPEPVKAKLRTGEISVNQAYKDVQRAEKAEKQEQKRQENLVLVQESTTEITKISDITQTFSTIVLDPPWDWGDEKDHNQMGRAKPEYATMSIDQLSELPIEQLSEKNAHIYLWITNRSLPKGFMLLEKWGFRYITCLTWCKPSIGMGNYYRGSSEQILFGVKGSLPLLRHDTGTWFDAPRPKRHSEKPQETFTMIEACSPPTYLELFARNPRENWFTWGGEL